MEVEEGDTVVPSALTGCYRPIPIGVSVGNLLSCPAGTLGCIVEKNTARYILSNNHVLARLNSAAIGEWVEQPGLADDYPPCVEPPVDGCTPRVARLSDYEPLKFDGSDNIWTRRSLNY